MTITHSIKTSLLLATSQLKAQGFEAHTAKLEAQLLLQHLLSVNRAWLITHQDENLAPSIEAAYRAMLQRRLNGEPIAYILGYREFYGLNLKVSADTLIPRADTETLVEAALAVIDLLCRPSPQPLSHAGARGLNSPLESPLHLRDTELYSLPASPRPLWERARERGEVAERDAVTTAPPFPPTSESMLNLNQKMDSRFRGNDELNNDTDNNQPRILDLGTGTGAIALAIAKHRPQAFVYAVDASQAALDIAIENAHNLKISNVTFILSDWFSLIKNEKFDVIVSNPPYIEADDAHLKQGDLRFEPISALASGADGLDAIRVIISQASQHLNPHGYLMLEHGYNQAESVASLLQQSGFSEISHAKDLQGINRVTIGRV